MTMYSKEKSSVDKTYISLKGSTVHWVTISLPTGAFFVCILLSLIFDFDASTATHCNVANYLPSISAAISLTPQRYIWRICIGLHSTPRLLNALTYHQFYKSFTVRGSLYAMLVNVSCLLNIIENLALITLSCISSNENYKIHEMSFIAFMLTSELYMLLACILFKWAHAGFHMTHMERKSFRLKVTLFIVNVSSFLLAVYFFLRHNRHCETGMYTVFAFMEYLVVLSNVAFHGTLMIDTDGSDLMVARLGAIPATHSKGL